MNGLHCFTVMASLALQLFLISKLNLDSFNLSRQSEQVAGYHVILLYLTLLFSTSVFFQSESIKSLNSLVGVALVRTLSVVQTLLSTLYIDAFHQFFC